MSELIVTHHKANTDNSPYPANSFEAVRASLEAGAAWIELDLQALQNGDYLILHDDDLAHTSSGTGKASTTSSDALGDLFIKKDEQITPYRVPRLSELVRLFQDFGNNTRLQLDFKNFYPFPTDEPLQRLLDLIAPIKERVLVSSPSDWQLRKLKRLSPELNVGFDIMLHFDLRDPSWKYPDHAPPYRQGAYGYHDDYMLSAMKIWSVRDYLQDRAEMLIHQVPDVRALFISHRTLIHSLDDGFNWMDSARHYGIDIAVWTVDVDNHYSMGNARRLKSAGFNHFISNTPLALAEALSQDT